MHKYPRDFYGATARAVILGYIRPELNYTTVGECPPFDIL